MTEKVHFSEIARNIFNNREEHEQKIKELTIGSVICSKENFFNEYQSEIKNIEAEITPTKENLSINHFKDIFQTFERYPSNLLKPKKTVPKELNRTLAACKTLSQSDFNSVNANNSITQNAKWDDGPSICKIYKDFRKFRQSLNTYLKEIENKDLEEEYTKKLQKLNNLAKEVEKLHPDDCRVDVEEAFNEQQTETLRKFVENMERGIYINSNRNLFKEDNQSIIDTDNFECVMELLSYWLKTVGQYNKM